MFDVSRIDIPEDLKIDAYAGIYTVSRVFIFVNEDELLKHDDYLKHQKGRKQRNTRGRSFHTLAGK